MSEIIMVIRSLIFATILAVILQFRVEGKTLETHVMTLAASQAIQGHLQLAAQGAVTMGRQLKQSVQSLARDTMNSFGSSKSRDQK